MHGNKLKDKLSALLEEIKSQGLYKKERYIESPQGSTILVEGKKALNFCSNNYLGLSNHPKIIEAAHQALRERGFGLSSVRFICGTQDIHKELEEKLSSFLGMEGSILFSSCFDANGGLFESILGEEDAIISDELNHASLIDGIRLCKAKRYRYSHRNMEEMEKILKETSSSKTRLIVTDGVFSMDGTIAPLQEICSLAEKYDALVMVDDSHATGFIGKHGRGSSELKEVEGKIHIISSTFGKALGGASGGFISAKKEIIEVLRQKARPYLFSNTLSPVVVYATLEALSIVSDPEEGNSLRKRLKDNTNLFRTGIMDAGLEIKEGEHPVVPVMVFDAQKAQNYSRDLLQEGIYVIGFFFPVVPKNTARIRVQLSASHTEEEVKRAIHAFKKVAEA